MPNPRKQKFVRGIPADPLKLQPRDIALLCDVAEFRFLNTPQILALHSGGKRNLLRHLASLFEHGYLDRPKQQASARLASSHLIYSLGRKGAAAIIGNAGEREGVYRRVKENEQTLPLIAHSLMVSQFRVFTIAPHEKRAENLCRAAKDADDRREGSLMYLFLSETRYNVETPEALLKAVWQSPKDDEPHSIV